jgi:hypothetical protein
MAEWQLTDADIERAEWFSWSGETAAERPELRESVADFQADRSVNEEAADDATRWFRDEAEHQGACITRILVVDGHIATFYAISSGEMTLESPDNVRDMGIHVARGPRNSWTIGVSHIEVIGRDYRAPAGVGMHAIGHAITVASLAADLQGNLAITLDPADARTQDMWIRRGFRRTKREAGDGLRRLYVPLSGPYYGPIDRGG